MALSPRAEYGILSFVSAVLSSVTLAFDADGTAPRCEASTGATDADEGPDPSDPSTASVIRLWQASGKYLELYISSGSLEALGKSCVELTCEGEEPSDASALGLFGPRNTCPLPRASTSPSVIPANSTNFHPGSKQAPKDLSIERVLATRTSKRIAMPSRTCRNKKSGDPEL
eukprot:1181124-Prorocentrum_minimum.AAC.6